MTHHTLSNGLRVYLAPVEGTATSTVLVMANVGSRYETPELSGASHFIEHMMFKGSKALPTPAHVARALDAIGADYNAYTSKEYTGYYVKSDAQHQQFAIQTLFDMTFDSLYQEEEMDRERGVIIEEINMYQDTPARHIEDLLEATMFPNNSLGWEIAGTPDTMRTMKRKDVIAFRDDHYAPSRMAIAIAGNVNEASLQWLEETFGSIKNDDTSKPFDGFKEFPDYDLPPVGMQKKVTEQIHMGIGFPGLAYNDPRMPAMKLLRIILGGNMSSRLFMSVREQGGLAYRIRAGHEAYEDTGIFSIVAGLDGSRLSEAMDRTFTEVQDLVENGPTQEELQRTKQFMKGHILMAMENSSSRAEWYAKRALFAKEVKGPEEVIAEFEAVTVDQIQALAQETFDRRKMTLSYIGPEADPDVIRAALPA